MKEYVQPILAGVGFAIIAGILFGALTVAAVAVFGRAPGSNVVALDGWEHGVAICEKIRPATAEYKEDIGAFVQRGGVFYVVNDGHIGDAQTLQLVKLAVPYCRQWRNK